MHACAYDFTCVCAQNTEIKTLPICYNGAMCAYPHLYMLRNAIIPLHSNCTHCTFHGLAATAAEACLQRVYFAGAAAVLLPSRFRKPAPHLLRRSASAAAADALSSPYSRRSCHTSMENMYSSECVSLTVSCRGWQFNACVRSRLTKPPTLSLYALKSIRCCQMWNVYTWSGLNVRPARFFGTSHHLRRLSECSGAPAIPEHAGQPGRTCANKTYKKSCNQLLDDAYASNVYANLHSTPFRLPHSTPSTHPLKSACSCTHHACQQALVQKAACPLLLRLAWARIQA